jgi:hypothetical protein
MPLSVLVQGDLHGAQLPSSVQQLAAGAAGVAVSASAAAAHWVSAHSTAVVVNANFFIGLHSVPNFPAFQSNFPPVSRVKIGPKGKFFTFLKKK